jgi:NAD(P)-dependent dehydrogenase (short-subunit alcohol dehydrogenase family)
VSTFDWLDQEGLRLDALVNNAGVVDIKARIDEQDVARWERMLRINVIGSMLCAREAVRRMSTLHGGDGGAIVNVSSAAARLGGPGEYVDYAASKGAIDAFTIGLAKEVATEGVRVNAVRPGITDTDIHASGGQPDRAARLAHLVPLGRPGTADEVAAAIVWLCSPAASYTTGAIIDVSGGR